MAFFCHSFAARRERDHAVLFAAERDIATAVLAGWRIEPVISNGVWSGLYTLYSPSGENWGYNNSRGKAAAYAIELMGTKAWWAR